MTDEVDSKVWSPKTPMGAKVAMFPDICNLPVSELTDGMLVIMTPYFAKVILFVYLCYIRGFSSGITVEDMANRLTRDPVIINCVLNLCALGILREHKPDGVCRYAITDFGREFARAYLEAIEENPGEYIYVLTQENCLKIEPYSSIEPLFVGKATAETPSES